MKANKARQIAIEVLDEFEELLGRKGVVRTQVFWALIVSCCQIRMAHSAQWGT
jgi:hypothetical protein